MIGGFRQKAVLDATLRAVAAIALASSAPAVTPRYAAVIDRAPFGPPPPSSGAADTAAASDSAAKKAEELAERAASECPLRLVALTRFEGACAAGFANTASGRSVMLRPGDVESGWKLVDLDPESGCAIVSGRVGEGEEAEEAEVLLRINTAPGQPSSIRPSPNSAYWTALPEEVLRPRADSESEAGSSGTGTKAVAESDGATVEIPPRAKAAMAVESGDTTRLTRQEEAELRRRATVSPPEGGEPRLSYRLLQSLRAEALRKKADAAREVALAAAAERARELLEEKEARQAAENEAKLLEREKEMRRRAGVVAALQAGYDVEVDFELSAQEAATLREAGYEVPDEALEDPPEE